MLRRSHRVICLSVSLLCSGAWALPLVEFSPSSNQAGGWTYNGQVGVLSFNQGLSVDRAVSSNTDRLVGAQVRLPSLLVTGSSGHYQLTPLGDPRVRLTDTTGQTTYFTGVLGSADLVTAGTTAAGYGTFQADLQNVTITTDGALLGSAALDLVSLLNRPDLDFDLSLQGASDTYYRSFADMIDGGYSGSSGLSGAISVPEPGTLALLGAGGLALARRRRHAPF